MQADPGRREAQRRLAAELTRLVHGDEGLATAQRATEIFFGAEISDLTDAQLDEIFADVPSKQLPRERLAGEGLSIVDALVEAGLAKSKGEARRIITQGGAYVNNRRIDGLETRLGPADLAERIDDGAAHGQEELCPAEVHVIRSRRTSVSIASRVVATGCPLAVATSGR